MTFSPGLAVDPVEHAVLRSRFPPGSFSRSTMVLTAPIGGIWLTTPLYAHRTQHTAYLPPHHWRTAAVTCLTLPPHMDGCCDNIDHYVLDVIGDEDTLYVAAPSPSCRERIEHLPVPPVVLPMPFTCGPYHWILVKLLQFCCLTLHPTPDP